MCVELSVRYLGMLYNLYSIDTKTHSGDCDRLEYCSYLGFVNTCSFLTNHETYLTVHVNIVFGRRKMYIMDAINFAKLLL